MEVEKTTGFSSPPRIIARERDVVRLIESHGVRRGNRRADELGGVIGVVHALLAVISIWEGETVHRYPEPAFQIVLGFRQILSHPLLVFALGFQPGRGRKPQPVAQGVRSLPQ
jgi:hypothetical protein